MAADLEDFRQRIIAHAKLVAARAPKVESEASTNTSLVQPFLTTLGYDVGNPDEVAPEHHADYSEKYKNKVDYAILHQGVPVIAIESKRVGSILKDHLGQLKSYFHALTTVKLGVLTDGLRYEFYADSDAKNVMDEEAFLRLDLEEVAKSGVIDDNVLGGIAALRRGSFNPDDVGAEAKRKLLIQSIVGILKNFKSEPSDDFIRFILGCPEVAGDKRTRLTQGVVDGSRDVVREAMEDFVKQEALARLGYALKDVVRAPVESPEPLAVPTAVVAEPDADGYSPSDAEIDSLTYAKNRLFYLVKNDTLFAEVQKITFRKSKTSFRVFYNKPNNGSLFDFKEQRDGTASLHFPALGGDDVPYMPSAELDDHLLRAFTQRVTEAGVAFDSGPVLRTIKGGA